MPFAAGPVKDALHTLLGALVGPGTLVSYGPPGTHQPPDIVAVMGQRQSLAVGPMSPQRRQDETVETDVVVSCFRSGGPEAQQVATEAAYALGSLILDHFKSAPNETLGGACREARVTAGELVESVAAPMSGAGVAGRTADLTLTVVTVTRI